MANSVHGRVFIQGTVINIRDNQVCYPSCRHCYSKLDNDGYNNKEWYCCKCGICFEKCNVVWRYRLAIIVANDDAVLNMALFGTILEPYFGKSASNFQSFMEQIDDNNLLEENMLMSALEETFVGQSFIFGIKSDAKLSNIEKVHKAESLASIQKLKLDLIRQQQLQDQQSDLVAIQILNSANTLFTGNTVIYNLKLAADLILENVKDNNGNNHCKADGDGKRVFTNMNECSYPPCFMLDQISLNSVFDHSDYGTSIELSYNKSVEDSGRTILNFTSTKNCVSLPRKNKQSNCTPEVFHCDFNAPKQSKHFLQRNKELNCLDCDNTQTGTSPVKLNLNLDSHANYSTYYSIEGIRNYESLKSYNNQSNPPDWDNSFSFTQTSPNTQLSPINKTGCNNDLFLPESEHHKKDSDISLLFHDKKAYVHVPKVSDLTSNLSFNNTQTKQDVSTNDKFYCDMPESEDLQAFLNDSSFDYEILNTSLSPLQQSSKQLDQHVQSITPKKFDATSTIDKAALISNSDLNIDSRASTPITKPLVDLRMHSANNYPFSDQTENCKESFNAQLNNDETSLTENFETSLCLFSDDDSNLSESDSRISLEECLWYLESSQMVPHKNNSPNIECEHPVEIFRDIDISSDCMFSKKITEYEISNCVKLTTLLHENSSSTIKNIKNSTELTNSVGKGCFDNHFSISEQSLSFKLTVLDEKVPFKSELFEKLQDYDQSMQDDEFLNIDIDAAKIDTNTDLTTGDILKQTYTENNYCLNQLDDSVKQETESFRVVMDGSIDLFDNSLGASFSQLKCNGALANSLLETSSLQTSVKNNCLSSDIPVKNRPTRAKDLNAINDAVSPRTPLMKCWKENKSINLDASLFTPRMFSPSPLNCRSNAKKISHLKNYHFNQQEHCSLSPDLFSQF